MKPWNNFEDKMPEEKDLPILILYRGGELCIHDKLTGVYAEGSRWQSIDLPEPETAPCVCGERPSVVVHRGWNFSCPADNCWSGPVRDMLGEARNAWNEVMEKVK